MSTPVPLPALGESVTEGTISRWLKRVGDHVDVDEPLVEVSTDKVDTEIPSPVAGVVLEILVPEDGVAPVGATLATIGEPSETAGGAPTPAAEPTAESAPVESAQADTQESTEATAAPATQPAPAQPAAQPTEPAPSAQTAPAQASGGTEVVLPQLGESVTEGTVSRWLKQVGDQVEADEPLVEVSTDKVDTEIPSPAAGVVLEIRVPEDGVAAVGSVLAVIGSPSAAPAAPAAQPAAPAPTPAPAPAQAAPTPTPAPTPAPAPVAATPTAPDRKSVV